jgi:hypothetical protein
MPVLLISRSNLDPVTRDARKGNPWFLVHDLFYIRTVPSPLGTRVPFSVKWDSTFLLDIPTGMRTPNLCCWDRGQTAQALGHKVLAFKASRPK